MNNQAHATHNVMGNSADCGEMSAAPSPDSESTADDSVLPFPAMGRKGLYDNWESIKRNPALGLPYTPFMNTPPEEVEKASRSILFNALVERLNSCNALASNVLRFADEELDPTVTDMYCASGVDMLIPYWQISEHLGFDWSEIAAQCVTPCFSIDDVLKKKTPEYLENRYHKPLRCQELLHNALRNYASLTSETQTLVDQIAALSASFIALACVEPDNVQLCEEIAYFPSLELFAKLKEALTPAVVKA
jgi:hypothetical protein